MSEQIETHDWQIETKSGSDTRVTGVAFVQAGMDPTRGQDYFEMSGPDRRPIFIAPLTSLAYAKRLS